MSQEANAQRDDFAVEYRPSELSDAMPEDVRQRLLATPGVVGFHRVLRAGGEEIVVQVRTPADVAGIPDLGGLRVRVEVLGTIRAY